MILSRISFIILKLPFLADACLSLFWDHRCNFFGLPVTIPLNFTTRVECLICKAKTYMGIHSLTSISGATPAGHLVTSIAASYISPILTCPLRSFRCLHLSFTWRLYYSATFQESDKSHPGINTDLITQHSRLSNQHLTQCSLL